VLLSLIGFLRWVFVVPPLAGEYVTGDETVRTAIPAAWTAPAPVRRRVAG